jgi:glucose/arabinose dehydrogenase
MEETAQKIADQLNFPTSIAISPDGAIYVAESGLPFGGAPTGGVVSKINKDGTRDRLIWDLGSPVNGLTWFEDSLLVSEGGNPSNPGRISRLYLKDGERKVIVDRLPAFGNYHTNMVVPAPDGKKLYFSQGAMTNSGIVGLDSCDLAWLQEVEHRCDIPGLDITISHFEAESADPRGSGNAEVKTSGFAPFGTSTAGQRIAGRVPCTAAILRCNPDGSNLELFAWGLRNAYGLGFLGDRLLALDQGADERGSRPIRDCPDFLYEVLQGKWYGWPDFFGGKRLTDPSQFVLANHKELPAPEIALVAFEPHICTTKFAVIPQGNACAGDLIVACFGDQKPITAPAGPRVGREYTYVSTKHWWIQSLGSQGLTRPIDVAFCSRSGQAYLLDFGEFEIGERGVINAKAGSGALWQAPNSFPPGSIKPQVSFNNDLFPIFRQFRAPMLWRLDLTNYEHVKANADKIYQRITSKDDPMPIPPLPPLTKEQIGKFKLWIDSHFPP